MVLSLSPASREDVNRIATIHLSAFNINPLLHAQFPTPSSLQSLHTTLSNDMLQTIQKGEDSGRVILIVRDSDEGNEIIAFAKWDLPRLEKGAEVHPDVVWHEDCRKEFLDGYHFLAEEAMERVLGGRKCFRLTFVATDPRFQGRGAGTLLTKWGLILAEQENTPVYLESTILASSLYRRLGFLTLDGLSMTLPGHSPDGGPLIYEELCMLKTWDSEEEGMDRWDSSLNISSLQEDYAAGMKPQVVVQAIYDRIEAYKEIQPSVWIYLRPISEVMKDANVLCMKRLICGKELPLWGMPFSVKDSIDIAGIPTSNGLPALAFMPTISATVFQKCIDAGGLFIGKTNMEQLVTGMTGCRSPYGTLHSTFSPTHIVGGSSIGSAVSVSAGLVSFSIGSDTAGSIRVPAAFNGVVGFKPTKGTVSTKGIAPACAYQDCVSFLASCVADVKIVWEVCKGYDKEDPFAKLPCSSCKPIEIGKRIEGAETPPQSSPSSAFPKYSLHTPPPSALKVCTPTYRSLFNHIIKHLESQPQCSTPQINIDCELFTTANDLLYNRSFVQERLTILQDGWLKENRELMHPVTREVFETAASKNSTAIDLFRDLHTQATLKLAISSLLTPLHDLSSNTHTLPILVVPTTPFHPTIEEVEKDPIGINTKLGVFTHFANVLDLTAIAVPCGVYEVDREGRVELPFGVTVLAGCGLDGVLLGLVEGLEEGFRGVGDESLEDFEKGCED